MDLMLIWNRQDLPESVKASLLALSELVLYKITDPKRGVANVTQWCKREACWTEVKKISFQLPDNLKDCLTSTKEEKEAQRSAKKEQKVVNEIYAQTEVVNYPVEMWIRLAEFAVNNRLASPTDVTALTVACKIPSKIPNAYQSKHLLILLHKAIEEGFIVDK